MISNTLGQMVKTAPTIPLHSSKWRGLLILKICSFVDFSLESRQKTFSSSLRFPWRHSCWAFLDHHGIRPIAMAKYVISPFFMSRQTSERKGDGLLASWPLLLSPSAVSQHCVYKEWGSGVMR